jgi:Na+-driven multidrug efflux pump
MVMSFLVSSFGTLAIATHGVGSSILQVITIPVMGVAVAVTTLMGQNVVAGNFARSERITWLGVVVSFGTLTLMGGIGWLCASWLVGFSIPNDPEMIAGGAHFIRIMALTWGGMGIQLCIVSAFRASGNMLSAMIIAMVSQWMIQFPLAYVLARHISLHTDGLCWSFPVTNVVLALISVLWFARGSWKNARLTEDDAQVAEVTREAVIEEGNLR